MFGRILLAMFVVVVTSCSAQNSDATADPSAIEGTWVLDAVSVEGDDLSLDPLLSTRTIEGVPAWITFETDGAFTGEGPCNGVDGRYRLEGGALVLAQVTAEAAACVDSTGSSLIMDTEDAFFRPLLEPQTPLSISLNGSTLVVADGTTHLEFQRNR